MTDFLQAVDSDGGKKEPVPVTLVSGGLEAGTASAPVSFKPSPATGTDRIVTAAASTNARVAKASPGTLRQASGYNAAASARYLRFYDTAGTPVPGTTAIRKEIYLPPLAPFVIDMNDGYATGIAYALTTGFADNDTGALTAGDILCLNVDYL